MNPFYNDIFEQPNALRRCIQYYETTPPALTRPQSPLPTVLMGMGASYQAALAMQYYAHSLGIPAIALESADAVHYSQHLFREKRSLVFISQSGKSGEVPPTLELLGDDVELIAVTNDVESPLAKRAHIVLPINAGEETTVASKTYVNTMATLWWMISRWAGLPDNIGALKTLADRIEGLLANAEATAAAWIERLSPARALVFLGHGPHAATARTSAMMVNEWAKFPAFGMSIAAYRHGFIESSDSDVGAVVFAPPGATQASALALADELKSHGARVLVVNQENDEFLAPVLDVIPGQLFAEAFARHRGIKLGFRYITKVVTQL